MFRESLEQDRGMLFIFENNDYHTFHMKNTFIPLDIAFIKEDGTIDSIEELDPMSPIPVSPRSEIRYAVEVNRGWFAENDVNVGDALLEEEELNEVKDKKGKGSGTKDACYYKVKSRYSVWPSAYASGALVKCRKVGAANWGNSKKEEVEYEYEVPTDSHYSWRNSLNEAPDSSMMKKPELHTRGGKTAPEPNSTQTAIKKVGQKLKDKFYEDTQINERTIAQKNSMQQRNKDAARARAQQMAKDRIAAKQKAAAPAPTPKPQPTQQAAPRPQVQKPVPKAAAPAPQRVAVPKPQTSVRTRGGGVQSAPKPSGLLSKIGSGIKRVAGGVADAATGNKFDFDKRGDTKLQDLGQGFVDNMTLGGTDFDEKGRSPVQNVVQNVFGLVRKGLTGRDGQKGQTGATGDRGLTGKDIISRVTGLADGASKFVFGSDFSDFTKGLLNSASNVILGGPVKSEEITTPDDLQVEQLNIPPEVTTSKVESNLEALNQRQLVADDVSQTATKGAGEGQIIPLQMSGGGSKEGAATQQSSQKKNILEMNQAGNQIPILTSVDPRNIHLPSTMSTLNIIDAASGL